MNVGRAFLTSYLAFGVQDPVCAFVALPVTLHALGPADFGLFAVATAIAAWGALLDIGIANATVRFVAAHAGRDDRLAARFASAAAFVYVSIGAAVLGGCAILAGLGVAGSLINRAGATEDPGRVVLAIGAVMAATLLLFMSQALFRGLQRFVTASTTEIVAAILQLIGVLVVAGVGGGVSAFLFVQAGIIASLAVANWWRLRFGAASLHISVRNVGRREVAELFAHGRTSLAIQGSAVAKMRSDPITISLVLSAASVTPYAVAARFADMPLRLSTRFLTMLIPVTASARASMDSPRVVQSFLIASRVCVLLYTLSGACAVILAPDFLTVWVGPEFASYADIVGLLVLASLFDLAIWPLGLVLQSDGSHGPLARIAMAGAVANVALSILLLYLIGLRGAALGSAVAWFFESIFAFRAGLPRVGVTARRYFRECVRPGLIPLLCTLGSAEVFVLATRHPSIILIMVVGVGCVGFGIGVYAAVAGPVEDRAYLSTVLRGHVG